LKKKSAAVRSERLKREKKELPVKKRNRCSKSCVRTDKEEKVEVNLVAGDTPSVGGNFFKGSGKGGYRHHGAAARGVKKRNNKTALQRSSLGEKYVDWVRGRNDELQIGKIVRVSLVRPPEHQENTENIFTEHRAVQIATGTVKKPAFEEETLCF